MPEQAIEVARRETADVARHGRQVELERVLQGVTVGLPVARQSVFVEVGLLDRLHRLGRERAIADMLHERAVDPANGPGEGGSLLRAHQPLRVRRMAAAESSSQPRLLVVVMVWSLSVDGCAADE